MKGLKNMKLAEKVEKIAKEEGCGGGALCFLLGMVDEMDAAKKMSDKELASEVLNKVWSAYKVDSLESALLGELIERFRAALQLTKPRGKKKCLGARIR